MLGRIASSFVARRVDSARAVAGVIRKASPGLGARPAALAFALLALACQAERRLVITSEPPGADVRLDGAPVGKTPLRIEFQDYGTRRVTMYKDGFLTHSQVVEVRGPWYARFPIDIFSEVLLPIGWKDVHRVHAQLEPGQGTIPAPDLRSVLDRAERLRRAGPEGPPPLPPEAEEGPEQGQRPPAGAGGDAPRAKP